VAGAAAAGGLVSATPARADWLTPGKAPAFIPHRASFADAAALAGSAYIKGYGFAGLPFPSEPGAFLSSALKAIFGTVSRCLCNAPAAVLNMVGLGGASEALGMSGGVGVGVGAGVTDLIGQIIHIVLHPLEHISQGVSNILGAFTVNHDAGRPCDPSSLIPSDTDRIFHHFLVLANPLNWPRYIAKFITSPLSIFEEFLKFFYPMQQTMNFNIKCECKAFPGVTLINKDTIQMRNPALDAFPPVSALYQPPQETSLVDARNPDGPTLCVIKEFKATVSHRKDLPEQCLCEVSPYPTKPITPPADLLPCSLP
jgi:hypothetical protein